MAVPITAVSGPLADLRLADLGLTATELREAVRYGYAYAAGCTANDPLVLPSTLAWGKGTGNLRDSTKPRGWKADRLENFESVVHPSGSHRVALAAGSADTGRRDATPRTRTPRGPVTHRAVQTNAQLSLATGSDAFVGTGVEAPVEGAKRETWLLLHFYDTKAEEIRLELSCPREMKGMHITAWRERIVIEAVSFAAELDFDFDEEDEAIDIDVPRRAD